MAFSPRLGFMIVGGQHRNRALSGQPNKVNGYHQGIWAATGSTWDYDPLTNLSDADIDDKGFPRRDRVETQWRGKRMVLRGSHPGCIERRDRTRLVWLMRDTCEFDGRLSLVSFNGSLLLFARANMASHGQRFVQVTRSRDDGRTWASFEPISIAGYEHTSGDVYFWAAQVNPVHAASLIATFPLVQHFSGCIGLSLSLDGVHWARVTPLLACDSVGERALGHRWHRRQSASVLRGLCSRVPRVPRRQQCASAGERRVHVRESSKCARFEVGSRVGTHIIF